MKTVALQLRNLVLFALIFVAANSAATAQKSSSVPERKEWISKNPFRTNVFVENLGQFDSWAETPAPIKYAINSSDRIFFSQKGLTVRLEKVEKMTEAQREKIEKKEGKEPAPKREELLINMEWLGCNANAAMEAGGQAEGYYTFGEAGYENVMAKGYEKLLYKDLYPGIDVEYIIPEKGGIKYKLIVHAGADISQVKMKYSGNMKKIKKDRKGNIQIVTKAGNIIDHAPVSFYENNKEEIISAFSVQENIVSFSIQPAGDKQQTIIIDPWTVTPASLATDTAAYDIDVDNAGNVYISGGTYLYKLSKYSSSGMFLWTFTLPNGWSSMIHCYSKFCILPQSGTIYWGEGSESIANTGPRLMKINQNGMLIYTTPNLSGNNEIWQILYNNCTGQLFAFGGDADTYASVGVLKIFSDTNITGFTQVNFAGYSDAYNDVASVKMDNNGDFYALFSTQHTGTNGHIVKSLSSTNYSLPPAFDISSWNIFMELLNLGIPGISPPGQSRTVRVNGLALNNYYLFSYDGKTIRAWDKINGSLLATLIVDAGYTEGGYRLHEGIDVDDCNNLYVGGSGKVHVYSFNGSTFTALSPITTNIPDEVYDIKIDRKNGLIYVCGLGFVTVLNAPVSCNVAPFSFAMNSAPCLGSACANVSGGFPPYTYLWSNGDTSACISGIASGTYYVTVSDNTCPKTSIVGTINVNVQTPVNPFLGNDTTLCGNNTLILDAGFPGSTYLWSTGDTSQTVTAIPGGSYWVSVTDNGCVGMDTINIGTLPMMSTASVSNNVSCNSFCDGTAAVAVAGGSPPYSYLWNTTPAQTTASISGLCAGAYTLTVTDASACTVKYTVTITEPAAMTSTISSNNALCNGENGSATITVSGGAPAYSYIWSNGQSTATVTGLSAGNYSVTVTDSTGCNIQQSITITEPAAMTSTISSNNALCNGENGSATITVSGGAPAYSYIWSNGQSTATVTGLSAGNYSVTVTDANNCSQTQTVSVISVSGINAAASATSYSVTAGDSTQLTAAGGEIYQWSPAAGLSCADCPEPKASPSETTTYCVVVSDTNNCKDSACVTIIVDIECGGIYVPTAFSPNNDGQNELECVFGNCIQSLYFAIYDRWGEKVFETTDQKICWDGNYRGKPMNTGVFVYYIKAVLDNNTEKTIKGNISLIR